MNSDTSSVIVIVMIALIFFVMLFFSFVNWVIDFSRELRSINVEIKRTTGRERMHYIKQRRRLFLSILPFVKY